MKFEVTLPNFQLSLQGIADPLGVKIIEFMIYSNIQDIYHLDSSILPLCYYKI
jgi:hypothetical protein